MWSHISTSVTAHFVLQQRPCPELQAHTSHSYTILHFTHLRLNSASPPEPDPPVAAARPSDSRNDGLIISQHTLLAALSSVGLLIAKGSPCFLDCTPAVYSQQSSRENLQPQADSVTPSLKVPNDSSHLTRNFVPGRCYKNEFLLNYMNAFLCSHPYPSFLTPPALPSDLFVRAC